MRRLLLLPVLLALAFIVVGCASLSTPPAPTADDRLLTLATGIVTTQADYVALSAANKVTPAEVTAWNAYVAGAKTALPALTTQWRAVRSGPDAAARATVDGQLATLESRYVALRSVVDSKK